MTPKDVQAVYDELTDMEKEIFREVTIAIMSLGTGTFTNKEIRNALTVAIKCIDKVESKKGGH